MCAAPAAVEHVGHVPMPTCSVRRACGSQTPGSCPCAYLLVSLMVEHACQFLACPCAYLHVTVPSMSLCIPACNSS